MTDTLPVRPADDPLAGLSLEERASLGSGAAFWTTKTVGPVEGVLLTDGPHGVRRQLAADDHLGIAPSAPATCFPPASGLGQSWDVELIARVGAALGVEARERGVAVLLGPGVNIRRDPRCGRNFEYFSEDPVLSGDLGAAWIRGVQSEGVAASVKHFAANNVEHDRMRSSSDVDPRPLREIYLRAFERTIAGGRPWMVMSAYNRINGVFASEDPWLLTRVLRDEWGFDGVVVSDWGAVTDRVASVRAGLDLEMPARAGSDAQVVAAVHAGELDEDAVTTAAARVALLVERVGGRGPGVDAEDRTDHDDLAYEAALRSIVLLLNDGTLPLAPARRIAVIGEFAADPRIQGGGSSRVSPTRVTSLLEALRMRGADVRFARGFSTDAGDAAEAVDRDAELRAEALAVAADSDAVVLMLGLGDQDESEGFDRDTIDLPDDQLALLEAVAAAGHRPVVALTHGGVVRLAPVTAVASAIVDGALLGQAGGGALADVLLGAANPSGRLTETVPLRIEDTPAFGSFPGEHGHVRYGEGLFVGYRGYDLRAAPVEFCFGHGLSYTTFAYDDLTVRQTPAGFVAALRVTNTGARDGREVVQLYTALPGSRVQLAPRELKAFAVVDLEAGESARVELAVDASALRHWDRRIDAWVLEGGRYEVQVGASSRDLRLRGSVELAAAGPVVPLTRESTVSEVLERPGGGEVLAGLMGGREEGTDTAGKELGMDLARMLASFPISRLGPFATADGARSLQVLLDGLNAR